MSSFFLLVPPSSSFISLFMRSENRLTLQIIRSASLLSKGAPPAEIKQPVLGLINVQGTCSVNLPQDGSTGGHFYQIVPSDGLSKHSGEGPFPPRLIDFFAFSCSGSWPNIVRYKWLLGKGRERGTYTTTVF